MSATSYSALDADRDIEMSRTEFERSRTVEFETETNNSRENMSFGEMFEEAKDYLRGEGGTRILSNLSAQVRDNPLPFALVGVGLAWLLVGGRLPHMPSRSSFSRGYDRDYDDDDYNTYGYDYEFGGGIYEGRSRYSDTGVYSGASHPDYSGTSYGEEDEWIDDYEGSSASGSRRRGVLRRAGGAVSGAASNVGGAVGSAASGVAGAASSVADGVGDAVSSVASGVSSAVGSVASGVGSAASQVGRTAYSAAGAVASGARYGGSRAYRGASYVGSSAYDGASDLGSLARRGLSDAMESDPLIVGALGIAAGAALGAMLPKTRIEDEYMGETRDHLIEEAEQLARQTYQQGKGAAQEAFRTAKSEASSLTGTGEGSIVDRVKDVARATYERVVEEGEEGGSGSGAGTQSGAAAGSTSNASGTGSSSGGTSATSFGETGSQGTGQTGGTQTGGTQTGSTQTGGGQGAGGQGKGSQNKGGQSSSGSTGGAL